ncbi:helix-turn-helix domain-containing protein [Desulfobulbus oligotrophicus]|uniref:Uncharacterized protein n=1 Tax=Desulfobulbus oligotrophicus TaxID=1909699 RepID=A0A7T5VEJ8_9BACT|nr:hypothetical protein [Desulfobulbus oligotrophicus]QQG66332.1 hypothetical protein HP555_10875 [Desulfobulbus oligotrophicus]
MQEKNQANVKERLQILCDSKNIKNIRELAVLLGVKDGRLYSWIKRNEIVNPKLILGKFSNINEEWLCTGIGEAFVVDQPLKNGRQFEENRVKKGHSNELNSLSRLRFKTQCGAVYFDDFFDFVAEKYGENKEGVGEFMEWLTEYHSEYREWIAEKKRTGENVVSGPPSKVSGAGK